MEWKKKRQITSHHHLYARENACWPAANLCQPGREPGREVLKQGLMNPAPSTGCKSHPHQMYPGPVGTGCMEM